MKPRINIMGWDGRDRVYFRKYLVGQWGQLTQKIRLEVAWAFKNRASDRQTAREIVDAARRAMRAIEADPPHWIDGADPVAVDAKYWRAKSLASTATGLRQRMIWRTILPIAAVESKRRAGLRSGANAEIGDDNRRRVLKAARSELAARTPPRSVASNVAERLGLTPQTVRRHLKELHQAGEL